MLKRLPIVIILILAVIFLPTALFLAFGMLPTFAAFAIDKTPGKYRTISVAAMNFAGCFPFILEFWIEAPERTVTNVMGYFNLQTFIIAYLLAAGGYAIEAAVTGITSSLIIQRSESRLKNIEKEQTEMVERWGEKVTGNFKLDDYGFPVNPARQKKQKTASN